MGKKNKNNIDNVRVMTIDNTRDLQDAMELMDDGCLLFDKMANNLYVKNNKSLVKVTETSDTEKIKNEIAIINNKLSFGYEQDKKLNEYVLQNANLINVLTDTLKKNEKLDETQTNDLNKAKEAWVKVSSGLVSAVNKNADAAKKNATDISANAKVSKGNKLQTVFNIVYALAIVALGLKIFLF